MAYVDTGGEQGQPVVFLHGNPTSSYLWRNIIPHVSPLARCLAPDLMGMGDSDTTPDGSYRFADHSKYLDAWFAAILPERDRSPWWCTTGDRHWASTGQWCWRHPDRIRGHGGLVYMEAIVRPVTWDDSASGPRQQSRCSRASGLRLARPWCWNETSSWSGCSPAAPFDRFVFIEQNFQYAIELSKLKREFSGQCTYRAR